VFRKVYRNKYQLYSFIILCFGTEGTILRTLFCLGHILSVTVYRQGVRNRLFGTEQVQSALVTVLQTGTVCIKKCATERYNLHFKPCYGTCTVCITSSSTFWPHGGLGRSVTCSDS